MKHITILVSAATALCLRLPARADDAAKTAAYQSSVSQEQLRLSSQRLKQDMIALAAEFSGYRAAGPELARLKAVIGSLDQVSEKDMAGVAQALAAASRSADPASVRGDLVQANVRQKEIQSVLLALADKLALQADEATLQKRIEELAIRQSENLHATRDLAALAAAAEEPSEEAQQEALEEHSLRKAEQASLEKEIGIAMETLRKIAKNADPAAGKQAAQALAIAETGDLEQSSRAASSSIKEALPESATHQQKVFENLKAMANTLAESRTLEEQTRELADAVGELSQKEQSLASKTPRLNGGSQKEARKGQQDIANRMDLLKERIAKLSEESAPEAEAVLDRSQNVADKIADKEFIRDAQNLALTADAQKDLAGRLAKVSETLQQQADALAEANSPPSAPEPEMTAEEQAIQDAMAKLLEAKANNQLAGRQNDQNQDYQERLAQARQELAGAKDDVAKAGQEIAQGVEGSFQGADKHATLAAAKKEPGHNLYHVNANIDEALATLQEAANQLAMAKKPGSGEGDGTGDGGLGEAKGPPVTRPFTAGSAAGDAQRDALTLLQQEKAAPDYEPMINQYIRNLADDSTPGQ